MRSADFILPGLIKQFEVDCLVGVPDSRLRWVTESHIELPRIIAPREDLAVAAAFGLALSGANPCVFMKDAGIGHCLDSILTLFEISGFPLVLLVSSAAKEEVMPSHHRVWSNHLELVLEGIEFTVIRLSGLIRALDFESHLADVRETCERLVVVDDLN